MARRSVNVLPLPNRQYRIDLPPASEISRFETKQLAMTEDRDRVRLLDAAAGRFTSPTLAERTRCLAKRIAVSDPPTCASSLCKRDQRIRIGGASWQLIEDTQAAGVAVKFVSIIPGGRWQLHKRNLLNVPPGHLLTSFRSGLYRDRATAGPDWLRIQDAKGWMILFIDGDYDPRTGFYQLHLHGFVAGDMIKVLEQLGTTPSYKSRRNMTGEGDPGVQRIQFKSLDRLPRAVTYPIKSYWSARRTDPAKGIYRHNSRKVRLSHPQHTQVLLWMDRWSMKDITFLLGVSVTREGLSAAVLANLPKTNVGE